MKLGNTKKIEPQISQIFTDEDSQNRLENVSLQEKILIGTEKPRRHSLLAGFICEISRSFACW